MARNSAANRSRLRRQWNPKQGWADHGSDLNIRQRTGWLFLPNTTPRPGPPGALMTSASSPTASPLPCPGAGFRKIPAGVLNWHRTTCGDSARVCRWRETDPPSQPQRPTPRRRGFGTQPGPSMRAWGRGRHEIAGLSRLASTSRHRVSPHAFRQRGAKQPAATPPDDPATVRRRPPRPVRAASPGIRDSSHSSRAR